MSLLSNGARSAAAVERNEFRRRAALGAVLAALIAACGALAVNPSVASAHGPVAPVATSYVARLHAVPAGLQAKIVDGYVRMWLSVPARDTVVVFDYRGVPYLRFTRAGVLVNENSEMYYLNQTPYPATMPTGLTRTTPAHWSRASSGRSYEWHDGRLQALASVALPAGVSYAGRWGIPLSVDGRRAAITGGLWRVADPSIVWFWPLLVMVLCFAAAWRVGSSQLDARLAQILGGAALIAIEVACVGRELHGRPGVTVWQWIELVLVSAFTLWAMSRLALRRIGFLTYLLIAVVALWQGLDLLPTLVNGYILIDLPGAAARAATVVCLGCAAGLSLLAIRVDEPAPLRSRRQRRDAGRTPDQELPRPVQGVS